MSLLEKNIVKVAKKSKEKKDYFYNPALSIKAVEKEQILYHLPKVTDEKIKKDILLINEKTPTLDKENEKIKIKKLHGQTVKKVEYR